MDVLALLGIHLDSDREGRLTDLASALQRLGIEPVGMAEIDGVFTEHVEVPHPTASKGSNEEPASASR